MGQRRSAQLRQRWPLGTSTGTPANSACTSTPQHPDLFATAASTCTPAGGMQSPTPPSLSPAPGTCPGTTEGGVVARRCGPDGRWVLDETGRPWRDHSQCQDPAQEQPLQRQAWLLEQFRLLYTVGYSLSLVALLLALLLLLTFRRLHCTRNFIHANLFLSFVLRAGAILTRDALLRRRLRPGPAHPLQLVGQEAVASCRLAQVVTQYCVGANYGWLLAEGLFLHKLLVLVAFSGRRCLPAFLLLGWGAPVLFVVPWVVARYLYENEGCWERNEKVAVWWIIRCPILVAVAVNFMVFVRIVRILVAKVRAHQVSQGDTRVRLARSTLTLIPLLGVHEVAFALLGEGHGGGTLRLVRLCLQLLLSSSQGLVVSVLYCFVNKEVQAEVRRGWQRCRLGAPGSPRAPPRGTRRYVAVGGQHPAPHPPRGPPMAETCC
ncbi:gastric inhibitory polypeptide receptor isoform X2 [Falco rusticolus]|uniref:gastric inhibitory polypeptide receptor isoform X2 n=1 Tax=Falco rusticolus TaxID=120794 RepID=UPI00188685DF|nr:gastric inhibitory polypeptide receptor isoform X2 [Falco rusticolus]XP_037227828.1 gastric inhibitory polypeptide receptor isoform X2 [Falco rusticolus]